MPQAVSVNQPTSSSAPTYRSLETQGPSVQEAADLMTAFISELAVRDR